MDDIMYDVSILVISFNTREYTRDCLASVLRQQSSSKQEVIVVDNNSDDQSAQMIRDEFPDVKLLCRSDNIGFGRANNYAARFAQGRYILLLNPDTIILDDAVASLVAFADSNPTARVWGGRTVFPNGQLNASSCWRFMTLWSLFASAIGLSSCFRNSDLFNREGYGGWNRDSVREVDIVVGAFLLIERRLWEELGGFDESFFMYAEEADLCYRARKLGARPLFSPSSVIVHYGGASERVKVDKLVKLLAGKMTFIRRHWSVPKVFCGVLLFKLFVLFRMVGFFAKSVLSSSDGASLNAAKDWLKVWKAREVWIRGYLLGCSVPG